MTNAALDDNKWIALRPTKRAPITRRIFLACQFERSRRRSREISCCLASANFAPSCVPDEAGIRFRAYSRLHLIGWGSRRKSNQDRSQRSAYRMSSFACHPPDIGGECLNKAARDLRQYCSQIISDDSPNTSQTRIVSLLLSTEQLQIYEGRAMTRGWTSLLSTLCRRFNRAWYFYEVALVINCSLKVQSILSL